MNALLLALFVVGVGLGLLVKATRPPVKPKPTLRTRHKKPKFDTVDNMVLWGEVNHDDFYR